MKQITNKEYEKYQEYQDACLHGRCFRDAGLAELEVLLQAAAD